MAKSQSPKRNEDEKKDEEEKKDDKKKGKGKRSSKSQVRGLTKLEKAHIKTMKQSYKFMKSVADSLKKEAAVEEKLINQVKNFTYWVNAERPTESDIVEGFSMNLAYLPDSLLTLAKNTNDIENLIKNIKGEENAIRRKEDVNKPGATPSPLALLSKCYLLYLNRQIECHNERLNRLNEIYSKLE